MKSCLIAITHSPIFTQYQDLIANDNLLKTFPASIIGCAALNTCDLRNNLLTSVPCELGSLVTMRALFLEGGLVERVCWLFILTFFFFFFFFFFFSFLKSFLESMLKRERDGCSVRNSCDNDFLFLFLFYFQAAVKLYMHDHDKLINDI
jgi:hypothetical protein